MTASLYIHVPFCSHKCDYCDFFSVPFSDNRAAIDAFITAVLDDVEDQLSLFNIDNVPTIYIGGGTPSVLGADRFSRLLIGLRALLRPMSKLPAEFTVEANPETADEPFLQACIDGGVNRISLGVQSFHEPSRQAVKRTGNARLLDERLTLAAGYFPQAFSADLITGLPFQTETILQEDIKRLLGFKPAHISLYSLTVEPETPLGKQVRLYGETALSLPCGDDADRLWITGRDTLESSGLCQYEVSNFAAPGKTCAHNIRYWRMENWLAAGPAASGTVIDDETGSGRRYTYSADIQAYLDAPRLRINSARAEELYRSDLIRECLLMGFRYREGPDPLLFKQRFGCRIEDCIPRTITRWNERGFFDICRQDTLAPSCEGLLFLNNFLRDAFNELGIYP